MKTRKSRVVNRIEAVRKKLEKLGKTDDENKQFSEEQANSLQKEDKDEIESEEESEDEEKIESPEPLKGYFEELKILLKEEDQKNILDLKDLALKAILIFKIFQEICKQKIFQGLSVSVEPVYRNSGGEISEMLPMLPRPTIKLTEETRQGENDSPLNSYRTDLKKYLNELLAIYNESKKEMDLRVSTLEESDFKKAKNGEDLDAIKMEINDAMKNLEKQGLILNNDGPMELIYYDHKILLEKIEEKRPQFSKEIIENAKKNFETIIDKNNETIGSNFYNSLMAKIENLHFNGGDSDQTIITICDDFDSIDSLLEVYHALEDKLKGDNLEDKLEGDDLTQITLEKGKLIHLSNSLKVLLDEKIKKMDPVENKNGLNFNESLQDCIDNIDQAINSHREFIQALEEVDPKSEFRKKLIDDLNLKKENLSTQEKEIRAIIAGDPFKNIKTVNQVKEPGVEEVSDFLDEVGVIIRLQKKLDNFNDKNEYQLIAKLNKTLETRKDEIRKLVDPVINNKLLIPVTDELLAYYENPNTDLFSILTVNNQNDLAENIEKSIATISETRKKGRPQGILPSRIIEKLDMKEKQLERLLHILNDDSFLTMCEEISALEEYAKRLDGSSFFTSGTMAAQTNSEILVGQLKDEVLRFINNKEMSPENLTVLIEKITTKTQEAAEQMQHRNIFSKAVNFLVGIAYQPNFFLTNRQIIADKILQAAKNIDVNVLSGEALEQEEKEEWPIKNKPTPTDRAKKQSK